MSNLATMIMEGSMNIGGSVKLTHSYDHEDGACLIAMESAEALRDIFEAEFYVPNTCTIAAALEGASCVEESSQAAIMEASVKGVFAKIKEFFIKLKEKVKEFLHNIKRYLTGIFGNDKKWVENYENELKALSDEDLKGYEVKMHHYTALDILDKAKIESMADSVMDTTKKAIDDMYSQLKANRESELDESDVDAAMQEEYENFLKDTIGDPDPDAIQKSAWSKVRNGATSEKDKDVVAVGKSQISEYIDAIKSSSKDINAFDNTITKVSKVYDKAIKFVNDCEKTVNDAKADDKGTRKDMNRSSIGLSEKGATGSTTITMTSTAASNYAMILRKYSSTISKMQSAHNVLVTSAKSALQERNTAYKKVLTGAFGYAKKTRKKNKKGGK